MYCDCRLSSWGWFVRATSVSVRSGMLCHADQAVLCIFISWIIQSGYSCWGYCHVHCKFEFFGTRNPEKVLLLVILSLFVGEICQNVYFDGSHLETPNRATPCQCCCHSHIRIGFLGVENPRKVVLFAILWLFVGQKCKTVFSDGGHFESSNMATPLKISFGSRQIRVQQVKMYLCTKFDAFVQICTFIPLTALTRWQHRGRSVCSMTALLLKNSFDICF